MWLRWLPSIVGGPVVTAIHAFKHCQRSLPAAHLEFFVLAPVQSFSLDQLSIAKKVELRSRQFCQESVSQAAETICQKSSTSRRCQELKKFFLLCEKIQKSFFRNNFVLAHFELSHLGCRYFWAAWQEIDVNCSSTGTICFLASHGGA